MTEHERSSTEQGSYSIEQSTEPEDNLPPRIFVRDMSWRVNSKVGNDRVFCHSVAPGQDHYHRLVEGEIFLQRGDERLCLPCSARRGLLAFEPKRLRERTRAQDIELITGINIEEFDLGPDEV